MSYIVILIIGVVVAVITFAAASLVGLQEASDPSLSKKESLTEVEKDIVDR